MLPVRALLATLVLITVSPVGCELEPVGSQPSRSTQTPAQQAWGGASVSGTGQAVKEMRVVSGTIVCEAQVSGNKMSFGNEAHWSASLAGQDYAHLIANDIATSGTWQDVVRVGSSGTYRVEVSAEQGAHGRSVAAGRSRRAYARHPLQFLSRLPPNGVLITSWSVRRVFRDIRDDR